MLVERARTIRAALWMVGTIVSFSVLAIAAREAGAKHDTFEIMTYRSLTGVILIVLFAAATRTAQQLRFKQIRLHFLRNTFHFAATNLWLFAVTVIPLAQVFAFEFSTPLWIAVLAPFILAEKLSRSRIVATVFGFIGILIIVRPGIVELSPGVAAAVLCAVGFAASAVVTSLLVRTESVTSILFWMCVIQSVYSIICSGIDGSITLPTAETLLPLLLVSICGLTAHLCLTFALKLAPATVVMPIDFARLPAIAIVGWLVYSESVDLFMVIGSSIILCANYANIKLATKSPN